MISDPWSLLPLLYTPFCTLYTNSLHAGVAFFFFFFSFSILGLASSIHYITVAMYCPS